MVEHATVFLAEDNPLAREGLRGLLHDMGHEVIIEAGDMESALAGVEQAKQLRPDVAVLDGNLTPGDSSCSDGTRVAAALHEAVPNIKVIGITSVDGANYGDLMVDKGNVRWPDMLLDHIRSL